MLRPGKKIHVLFVAVALTACNKAHSDGDFNKSSLQKVAATNEPAPAVSPASAGQEVATTVANGSVKGTLRADSSVAQILKADPASGALAGTSVTFPPGTFAVDTEVSISSGSDLATAVFAADLGIDADFAAAGAAVTLKSSGSADPAKSFTLTLALPDGGAGLAAEGDLDRLVVLYRITKAGVGREFVGVIPKGALTLDGRTVSFTTSYFGTFQTAYSSVPVGDAKEAEHRAPVTVVKGAGAAPADRTQAQSTTCFSLAVSPDLASGSTQLLLGLAGAKESLLTIPLTATWKPELVVEPSADGAARLELCPGAGDLAGKLAPGPSALLVTAPETNREAALTLTLEDFTVFGPTLTSPALDLTTAAPTLDGWGTFQRASVRPPAGAATTLNTGVRDIVFELPAMEMK